MNNLENSITIFESIKHMDGEDNTGMLESYKKY